jgi:hypothetical protein
LKVLVLSKDKISQNMFRSRIKNLGEWVSVGTHSNQTAEDIRQRLEFSESKPKTLFFHALKKSFFVTPQEWVPEPVADYPKALWEQCDTIIYTKTLFQGGGFHVLKGNLETSGLIIEQE